MKLLLTSPLGCPESASTWSNAPAHIAAALRKQGFLVESFDSGGYGHGFRALQSMANVLQGYPWNGVSWFAPARRLRGRKVVEAARSAGAEMVLTTSTLDAPVGQDIPYCIWIDNSWNLLDKSSATPGYSKSASDSIDRLEYEALHGAHRVFTFSKHLRENIVAHYGVPSERVVAVGCGAGPVPPLEGEKCFAEGHLLFVAKHLFTSKGGDLLLEAWPTIRAARPQTRLILVGNDEARTKALGHDGVEVKGYIEREELNRLFHGAAMLVQPMLADPWGQVYLEAMKARAVIVSLEVAALPELTDGGRLGSLIPYPDPDLLAEAVLNTYSRSQESLEALTLEAQARAMRLYDWDAVAKRMATCLNPIATQVAEAKAC